MPHQLHSVDTDVLGKTIVKETLESRRETRRSFRPSRQQVAYLECWLDPRPQSPGRGSPRLPTIRNTRATTGHEQRICLDDKSLIHSLHGRCLHAPRFACTWYRLTTAPSSNRAFIGTWKRATSAMLGA